MHPNILDFPYQFTEELSFQVRLAESQLDFEGLCAVRTQAYARHAYASAALERLASVDAADRKALMLVAVDKASQAIVGTMRLSSSLRGETPANEHVLAQARAHGHAEASHLYLDRVALVQGAPTNPVLFGLFKAMWHVAVQEQVQWALGSALKPLTRLYRQVGMYPLDAQSEGFDLPHVHPGRYYAIGGTVAGLKENVAASPPQVRRFLLETYHPDLSLQLTPRS